MDKCGIAFVQQDQKLFASKAKSAIGFSNIFFEDTRKDFDGSIAHVMPIGVIDHFEKVDIYHKNAITNAIAFGLSKRFFDVFIKVFSVVKSREGIGGRRDFENFSQVFTD